jgi:hypothetical protein
MTDVNNVSFRLSSRSLPLKQSAKSMRATSIVGVMNAELITAAQGYPHFQIGESFCFFPV